MFDCVRPMYMEPKRQEHTYKQQFHFEFVFQIAFLKIRNAWIAHTHISCRPHHITLYVRLSVAFFFSFGSLCCVLCGRFVFDAISIAHCVVRIVEAGS